MTSTTTPRPDRPLRRRLRPVLCTLLAVALVGTAVALAGGGRTEPAEAADVPPVENTTNDQVTADPLPTVQVDGVVWDQEIVGDTVYAVGDFDNARPPGAAPGTNLTPRANVLAYDLTTGQLRTEFVANTNAQVKTVTASPDGSRIYIGGQFTSVNGVNRYRIAALNPTTGAVITGFNAITDYIVNDLAVTDTTVYAAGAFNGAGPGATTPRAKLAAFSASNGALLPWAPAANSTVQTILVGPGEERVFIGGSFTAVSGTSAYGLAALDPSSGAVLPWAVNQTVRNAGSQGAILDLRTDGTAIYGSGYTFDRQTANLEGAFKAHPVTGEIEWLEDCHGDTYAIAPVNGYVYTASHAHFCGNVGGFPQSDDLNNGWLHNMRHALSFADDAAGTIRRDNWSYYNFEGLPAPSLTTWFPEWGTGTFTGQGQATWTVDGNSDYVVYGGEFTRVNSLQQQGLVRFARRPLAPRASGPRLGGPAFRIRATSPAPGQVRLSFPANYDRDDGTLTYRITRDGTTVHTTEVTSTYWDQPTISFNDRGLTPGQTYTYRVNVTDRDGNAASSDPVPVTVATTGTASPYADQVIADGARIYWRLGDPAGSTTAQDSATFQTGTANAMTFGRPGAIAGDPDTAARPNGTNSRITQPPFVNFAGQNERHPVVDEFSIEAWIRTTTTQGGRIIGFGNSGTGTSGSSTADRMLYMTNTGRVMFGVRTRPEGTAATSSRVNRTIMSGTGINDGQWHHVVGTLDPDGMRLYVDGELVASRDDVNSGHGYYGYWRVGSDTLSGWTSAPSSTRFNGDIDEAAVYYEALTPEQVATHHDIGTGDLVPNAAPVASFTVEPSDLTVAVDGSGSTDADGTIESYEWDFGDGETATGATASHTYAEPGEYTITLTVTDDGGATATATETVTVTAPPEPGVVAADTFERSATNGWGQADVGGSWALSGSAANFAVSGGGGRATVPAAGQSRAATLSSVAVGDVDATVDLTVDKDPTGGGTYVGAVVRKVGNTEYRLRAHLRTTGTTLQLLRVVSGAETIIGSQALPLVYSPGQVLHLRVAATGSGTTTLTGKLWVDGEAEPGSWQVQATDATAALQQPGAVGVHVYVSGSATNAPVVLTADNLLAREPE
ncbi:MAG TPA: PKD domain-containing protein [Acidimicrobiales bacterium]